VSETTTTTVGCRHKTDETLVLYDQCSCSVADDVTVTTPSSPMTSYHVVSVLLRRLKQDGFRVYMLDGKPAIAAERIRISPPVVIYMMDHFSGPGRATCPMCVSLNATGR